MKTLVVIAYDIVKDRRRNKVAKALEDAGIRKNYSVFECFLTTAELKRLQEKIGKMINKKTDSVLYYPLCRACAERMYCQGVTGSENSSTVVV
ncbi:MAG: CRISPR-associated endonuclease Cas2 [Bacteroidales bacterium]|nr:CRISPR-associated endonuclease Cas2 [Bacteroidales bacterium]